LGLLDKLRSVLPNENEGSTVFDAEPSDINLVEPDQDLRADVGDADSKIPPPTIWDGRPNES
jgi:hypothetical protein